MKHMFGGGQFGGTIQGSKNGMGFRPGPVQIQIAPTQQGHFSLGGPAGSRSLPFRREGMPGPSMASAQPSQMEGECADGSCSLPQPSNVQAPTNRIPIGGKADCPVCRSFGGRSSF